MKYKDLSTHSILSYQFIFPSILSKHLRIFLGNLRKMIGNVFIPFEEFSSQIFGKSYVCAPFVKAQKFGVPDK